MLAATRERERDSAAAARAAELRAVALAQELRTIYAETIDLRSRWSGARGSAEPVVSEEVTELRHLFGELAQNTSKTPAVVTIVIPAYEKVEYTIRCLRSIAVNWSSTVNPDIVVVDDASPDGSGRQLIGIGGIDVLFNNGNQGYLRSSNRGAALAKTKYVCFLNNDTEVAPEWLDRLVSAAEEDETIGAVGSKLVYPDGRLQEAGSIIWSDASGWNYGRGDDPTKSSYNFIRDVDYCSGASLLVRTELLREIGGYDERYTPAYYEDADLCFEIRRRGYRVVYEPRSELVHHEGVSSGTDISSGTKRYQEVNRHTFAQKWAAELERQFPPSPANVERARSRKPATNSILVIDTYVPLHDREAGSNRLFKIIKIFLALDYHVIFMPENYGAVEPYTSDLIRLGVEVMYWRGSGIGHDKALAAVLPRVRIAWICRPELCEKYAPIVRSHSTAAILYDTIDLHFLRERRQAELENSGDESWRETKELELACARSVDATVTVTSAERDELLSHGVGEVFVVPTIHDMEEHLPIGFDARQGLLFIGGYSHTPNVDAVQWLCTEIMPIVWQSLPDIRVTLLGSSPPERVRELQSDRVLVTGYVANVTPFFEESRIFVAPIRYGAGMKGKIGHALSYGLPVITTRVGSEGYELFHGMNCIIADDAEAFARGIIRLYRDRELWATYAEGGRAAIASVGSSVVSALLSSIIRKFIAAQDTNADSLGIIASS